MYGRQPRLGKLRGSRRVGACSSAPREAAPTDDYRGSDRGLTRGAPRVVPLSWEWRCSPW